LGRENQGALAMASFGRCRRLKGYIETAVKKHGYAIGIRTIIAINLRLLRKRHFNFSVAEDLLARHKFKGSSEQKALSAVLRSILGVQYARPKWEESLGDRNPGNGETGLPDLWGHLDDPAELAIENDDAMIVCRDCLTSKIRKVQRGLTPEEKDIARMSKAEIPVARIAEILGISPATVYRRLDGLKQKYTELVREFRESRV
jgi:DNA-binding CsgD family transcriptional regulator